MEKTKYKNNPQKIGNASREIVYILEKNNFNYEEILKVIEKVKYEVNRSCYIRVSNQSY